MPITPRFVLSQTEDVLTVTIRVPHVRVSASTLEIVIDDDAFHFFSSPYLLRLSNLPGRLVDDAESGREAKAVYDPSRDNGTVTVTIHKAPEDVGQWDGLDLVGRLMMTSQADAGVTNGRDSNASGRPAIEVLSSEDVHVPHGNDNADKHITGTNDNGTIAPENAASALLNLTATRYGFLQLFHSVFTDLAREGLSQEMLELPEPDITPEGDRRSMRLDVEADKFDPGRYVDDVLLGEEYATDSQYCDGDDGGGGDMIFDEAVRMEPHWKKSGKTRVSIESITGDIESLSIGTAAAGPSFESSQLSEDEMQLLASIPATNMPPVNFASMNQSQIQSTLLSLLDILFAYAYDHRTTGGDPTVESSWTVAILSPTLSWFDKYDAVTDSGTDAATHIDTPADVFFWCIRRSLVYPYLRSYNLGVMIANDVISILRGGRRVVLRCLLSLRKIFENSTGHYLLNKLYIDPYIFWIQSIDESVVSEFAKGVEKLGEDLKKDSSKWKERIGLNLIGIERMLLYEVQEDENESEDEALSDSHDELSNSDDSSSGSKVESDSDGSLDEEGSAEISADKVSTELLRVEDDVSLGEVLADGNGDGKSPKKALIQEL